MWMVCFTNCGRVWWRHLTKPGFRHVFAMTYCTDHDVWTVFEWSRAGIDIYPASSAAVEYILNAIERRGGEAWAIQHQGRGRRFPLGFVTCVSAVKHLIGIRSWAVTPHQLRSELSRRGAKRIVSSHD